MTGPTATAITTSFDFSSLLSFLANSAAGLAKIHSRCVPPIREKRLSPAVLIARLGKAFDLLRSRVTRHGLDLSLGASCVGQARAADFRNPCADQSSIPASRAASRNPWPKPPAVKPATDLVVRNSICPAGTA